jgi:hypothetical protein
MRILNFSFKREAIWMVALNVVPGILGLIVLLLLLIFK